MILIFAFDRYYVGLTKCKVYFHKNICHVTYMGRQICKKMAIFFFFAFGAPLWIYDIIKKNAYVSQFVLSQKISGSSLKLIP